jgi:hypothetical protein
MFELLKTRDYTATGMWVGWSATAVFVTLWLVMRSYYKTLTVLDSGK